MDTATVPLYLSDMRCREFTAAVSDVAERAVCLDRTAFYPGGGGLPSDRGSLAHDGREVAILSLRDDAGRVWHELDGVPPAAGTPVTGRLDWPFRYGVMRHHTAIHVLCGVVYHLFGAVVTGGQIRTDRARIDLTLADLNRERVQQIEDEANRIIAEGRPIKVYTVPRETLATLDLVRTKQILVPEHVRHVRVVEIEGFDAQADGGTHVSTTRECGRLRIVKTENKGKHNKRLEIALEGDQQ